MKNPQVDSNGLQDNRGDHISRIKKYVAKKVRKTTAPKRKPKIEKSMVRKRIKITAADIEAERIRSGYTGKMTPYIKRQLTKKAKARKMGK